MTSKTDARGYALRTPTLRSRILNWLGCTLIGTPSALKMPEDYYWVEADRLVPAPSTYTIEDARNYFYVDGFRRIQRHRTALWAAALILAAQLLFSVLIGVGGAASRLVSGHAFSVSQEDCETAIVVLGTLNGTRSASQTGGDLRRMAVADHLNQCVKAGLIEIDPQTHTYRSTH